MCVGGLDDVYMCIWGTFSSVFMAAAVLGRADLSIPLALGMGKYVETDRFTGLQTAFLE